MKKLLIVVLLCILMIGTVGCKKETGMRSDVNVFVATDLHYISPEICDFGPIFMRVVQNSDGKLTEKMPEILDYFSDLIIKEKPDAVLLTGDLTFNGEKVSLLDLQKRFLQIEEAGIPVLVIPGNHDIGSTTSFRYSNTMYLQTPAISQEEFIQIMGPFGYDDAIERDTHSFSYIYALKEDLWILGLDANTEKSPGAVLPETLAWAEEQLQKAKQQNIEVIAMTHQNVVPQNDLLVMGFVIRNRKEVQELFQKYDVYLNLSGHSHLQHVSTMNGITDICTECMSLAPIRYGYLTRKDNQWNYDMRNLPIFKEEAEARFHETMQGQIVRDLQEIEGITEEEVELMRDFASRMNLAYFSGTLSLYPDYEEDPAWKLWEEKGQELSWYLYMRTFLREANPE